MSLRSFVLVLALSISLCGRAQTSASQPPGAQLPAAPTPASAAPPASPSGAGRECALKSLQICALHVLQDEKRIVTSPLRVHPNDLLWIAPFVAGTGYTLTQDDGIMQDLGYDPKREKDFKDVSDVLGIYAPLAYSGVAYVASSIRNDETLRETSVLTAEAMADAYILNTGLKYAINRQDPSQGDGSGKFWPHGTRTWPDGQSMPSEHCINVWAFARVVATEYPGWRTKAIVYGMATTVSFSRVIARQHFPSDVIVGSTFGYLIGGVVIHQRAAGMGGLELSSIQTPNGKGVQISYNFSH